MDPAAPPDRVRERGATAIEYALLASMIAAVIAAIVGVLGGQVIDLFSSLVWP